MKSVDAFHETLFGKSMTTMGGRLDERLECLEKNPRSCPGQIKNHEKSASGLAAGDFNGPGFCLIPVYRTHS
ncbi:MAG: hypothetical protein R2860_08615 [Desulfobacterales bacterium]